MKTFGDFHRERFGAAPDPQPPPPQVVRPSHPSNALGCLAFCVPMIGAPLIAGSKTIDPGIKLLALGWGFFASVSWLTAKDGGMVGYGVATMIACFVGIGLWVVGSRSAEATREAQDSALQDWQGRTHGILVDMLSHYTRPLRRNRKRLLVADDYGFVDPTKWRLELHSFLAKVQVPPVLGWSANLDRGRVASEAIPLFDWIETFLDDAVGVEEDTFTAGMSGTEYEDYCAQVLRDAGWSVRVAGGSGDHGVDLFAERDGETLVVQCKQYGGTVGNAAVQQALAGKAFESAQVAAVVAPSDFTAKARELAHSTGVLLLHHDDLASL